MPESTQISVALFNVIADGEVYEDADGNDSFTYFELGALEEELNSRGYLNIEVVQVSGCGCWNYTHLGKCIHTV